MRSISNRGNNKHNKSYLATALGLGLGAMAVITCSQPGDANPDDPGSADPDGGTMATDDGGTTDDGGSSPGTDMKSDGSPVTPPMEVNGTETPVSASYWPKGVDQGVADPDDNIRFLVMLQIRDQVGLANLITNLYDPSSSQFRKYLSASDFLSRHAPTSSTVDTVSSWFTSKGFKLERTATNRLLLQFSGTARQFNTAFGTELHNIKRTDSTWRAPALAPIAPIEVPQPLIGQIKRLLMPDMEAESGTLSPDSAPVLTTPPAPDPEKLTPAQITKAYGITDLYAQGFKGAGMTIGVIGATMFRFSDSQSMWQTYGITRKDPTVVQTMEPMITRDLETSLDIQLSGAIAPDADVIYYGGPDNSDTTLLYTFNEAIGQAKVQVISDSFAHAEATTPVPISYGYNESAMMAAALGITVVSAAGDSAQVDVPSNAPYVTAVGGTNVELNSDSSWKAEQSWGLGGCGLSRIFTIPSWQQNEYSAAKGRRTVADVGTVVGPYWVKYLGQWTYADGTSASTPVFAALVALINQSRNAKGKPPVGFLNPILYKNAATRATFRDITTMGYGGCATSPGYDLATGIGSPTAALLANAIP